MRGVGYVDDMSQTERSALLLLLRHSGRSWSSVTDEVEERGSALAVLAEGSAGQMSLFDGTVDDRLDAIEDEIAGWERAGMRFVTLLDPEYPPQLLTIHQRSPFVMWRGTPMADDASGVAIVGTRHPSDGGARQAESLAYGLARRGVTVISGLAAGIDSAAHTGALRARGRTVAVIGNGLQRVYPKENEALQQRIARDGLVLSQFLPDTPPTSKTFPMRNAIMSGYAAATVVVEASWRSGARMQARLALEHGRRVFLMRSLLEHDWARDYARRPGASVVSDVDDVMHQLEALATPRRELVWA